MIRKDFKTQYVFYCPECFNHSNQFDLCEHEYIHMIFILSNGAKRINKICKRCWKKERGVQNYKLKDFDLSKLLTRNNEKYHEYINNQDHSEWKEISDFYKELYGSRYEIKQKEWWDGYTEYMNSPGWLKKREEILNRDQHTCKICGENAEQVHHLSYVHKPNEYTWELVSLCKKCHFEHYHPERINHGS